MTRRLNSALIFLFLIAFSAAAQAAPVVRVTTTPENGKSIEVSATEATTPQEVAAASAWIARELEAATAQAPGLKPEIAVAEPGPDGKPAVTEVAVERRGLARLIQRLYDEHYRVTFTVVRGLANSSVVSWGLILSSHVSLAAALPVGLVAGGMSAGFQFFNQKYQAWLMRSRNPVGRLGRNFLINIGYMGLAKVTALATGIPHEPTFLAAAGIVLKTAFLGTLAQGTWNLGVAERSRVAIEQSPERARRVRQLNDLKTLSISMVSTALSIASLVGAPFSDAAMYLMTGTGIAYYTWSIIKSAKWSKEKIVRDTNAKLCAQQLVEP